MRNYKLLLLERLLDKYERSRQFSMETTPSKIGETSEVPAFTRRILLHLQQDFQEYNVEDTDAWGACNQAVRELEKEGVVGFRWAAHEKENIISQVWLLPEGMNRAYEKTGRLPKRQALSMLLDCIDEIQSQISMAVAETDLTLAAGRFLQEEKQHVAERNSSSAYLPKEPGQAEAVLLALGQLCSLPEEGCIERAFSMRCFGDSKFFEKNVKSRLIRILRDYLPELGQDAEIMGEDLLQWAGIYRAPEEMSLCGPLQIHLPGGEVNLGLFPTGVSINRDTVRNMEVKSAGMIQEVFFIENKANYTDFVMKRREETILTVFHGGFYSPAKGLLFQKIYQALGNGKGLRFYHWGDLDLGGFQMHRRLRENLIPELRPWRMDKEAFFEGKAHWSPLEKGYKEKLRALLEQQEYQVFWPVIQAMLENNAKLEQEAFLL